MYRADTLVYGVLVLPAEAHFHGSVASGGALLFPFVLQACEGSGLAWDYRPCII